jgi:cell division protein FtsX
VAVVVVALSCGAVAGTAGTLVALRDTARDHYIVTVFLTEDVTATQKTAVEAALSRLYPARTVQLQDRERTRENLRELNEDALDGDGEVPESFRVELAGTSIDCAALVSMEESPGVRMVIVFQPPAEGRPNTLVLEECP